MQAIKSLSAPLSRSRISHHQLLAELKKKLNKIYGARLRKIILFGSYARSDADEESDIDLLIVLDQLKGSYDEIRKLVPLIADLNLKYGLLASCFPISYTDYEKRNTPFLMNVSREGVVVYG